MEFWGVEVKPGKPFSVMPGDDKILHLSQATLGEVKKDKANESVTIFVNIGDQKLVLGILSPEKFPQLSFDLVFEKKFELSHNCKHGSVYFLGYQTYGPQEGDEFSDLESDEEQDIPQVNGNIVIESDQAKTIAPKSSNAKPESSEKKKVKLVEPSKDSEEDDESDDEDDDESDEDDSDDESNEMLAAFDDEDDDEEEDEETPKKAEVGKKRLNESATKTPLSSKKSKSETQTPQKTDSKKSVHIATPHPTKNAGKTPATSKSNAQTPKSGGQFSCQGCKKSFTSDKGLESHNKAKHAAK